MALPWMGVGSFKPAVRVAWTSGAGSPSVLNIIVVDSGLSGSRHNGLLAAVEARGVGETPHGTATAPAGSMETFAPSGGANGAELPCAEAGTTPSISTHMMQPVYR